MKATISKLNCVAGIGLVVCLIAISDARAQSGGSVKVNENAAAFASQLIHEGRLIADGKARGASTNLRLMWKTNSSACTGLPNTRSGISAWTNVTL
jgi:hypothetical protein